MYSHTFHLAVLMVETGLLYMLHVLDKNIQIEEGKRKRNLKRTSITIMYRALISSWVTFSCCLTASHMYFLLKTINYLMYNV